MTEQTSTAEQLNDLRKRYLEGKAWSREELKSAILTMLGDRLSAVQNAEAPKTKKAKPAPVSLDDLIAPPATPKQIAAPEPPPVAKVPVKKPPVTGFF